MNVVNEFASEMNVELQGKNINKYSAGIVVEKFECVEKIFNRGMGEKSADIFGGRMVNEAAGIDLVPDTSHKIKN